MTEAAVNVIAILQTINVLTVGFLLQASTITLYLSLTIHSTG